MGQTGVKGRQLKGKKNQENQEHRLHQLDTTNVAKEKHMALIGTARFEKYCWTLSVWRPAAMRMSYRKPIRKLCKFANTRI